jgi:ketosteroid isomerase-like protein
MNRSVQFLDNRQAQRNIEAVRRSCVVLSIVCLLCSGVPGCPAQQSDAVRTPLTPDTKAFQQLENRWSEAIGKRDQYALELVLSPELVDVSATGDVTTRNQQIAMLFEKGGEPLSLDQRVLNARIFGNLAVVIGTYSEHRRIHGKPAISNGMFTHVYQNARGNWLCIHAHRTAIAEGALQKTQGAADSKTMLSASPPAPATEHTER